MCCDSSRLRQLRGRLGKSQGAAAQVSQFVAVIYQLPTHYSARSKLDFEDALYRPPAQGTQGWRPGHDVIRARLAGALHASQEISSVSRAAQCALSLHLPCDSSARKVLQVIPQQAGDAAGRAAAGIILLSLSDEANALLASWAYQVATVEEHHDPVIVNAHDAEMLILILTMRLHVLCAGCNLQRQIDSSLHDLMSGLMCTRTPVRPSRWQSAAWSISERTMSAAYSCLMKV